ncbi:response regulator transcription factor [Amycolatopsis sp. lyj-112]|uniref:response regulator transcription factor n=1 Tax=Amycolatopsis sp. lyj-112 TaxID=2789288 RepID=UPI00397E0238
MTERRNPLTDIELDVLEAVARGLENQQIALAQHRSIETIRTHMKNIFSKLKARNRTHAVAIAFHVGMFRGRPASATDHITHTRHPLLPPHARITTTTKDSEART